MRPTSVVCDTEEFLRGSAQWMFLLLYMGHQRLALSVYCCTHSTTPRMPHPTKQGQVLVTAAKFLKLCLALHIEPLRDTDFLEPCWLLMV